MANSAFTAKGSQSSGSVWAPAYKDAAPSGYSSYDMGDPYAGFKQAITIQNGQVDATLTDYPFLITRDHFDDAAVDPDNPRAARTDGGDLRFYSDANLTTQLACDVVAFAHDSATGAADADIQVHVKVASVSSSVDTTIYVTYDVPGEAAQPAVTDTYGRDAVWADYWAVWHLEEAGDGTADEYVDSTGNGHDGQAKDGASANAPMQVSYEISNGVDFDASNDGITVADDSGFPTTDYTIEFWAKADGTGGGSLSPTNFRFTRYPGNNTAGTVSIYQVSGTGVYQVDIPWVKGNIIATSTSGGTSTHHITLTKDSSDYAIYMDGSSESTATDATSVTDSGDVMIGWNTNTGAPGYSNGPMDEVRVSSLVRASGWISSQYNNQNAPASFATAGSPTAI